MVLVGTCRDSLGKAEGGSVIPPDTQVMPGLCNKKGLDHGSVPDHPLFLEIRKPYSLQYKPLVLHAAGLP